MVTKSFSLPDLLRVDQIESCFGVDVHVLEHVLRVEELGIEFIRGVVSHADDKYLRRLTPGGLGFGGMNLEWLHTAIGFNIFYLLKKRGNRPPLL